MRPMVKGALALGILLSAVIVTLLITAWDNFGSAPTQLDTVELEKDGRWGDGVFLNEEPMFLDTASDITRHLRDSLSTLSAVISVSQNCATHSRKSSALRVGTTP